MPNKMTSKMLELKLKLRPEETDKERGKKIGRPDMVLSSYLRGLRLTIVQ